MPSDDIKSDSDRIRRARNLSVALFFGFPLFGLAVFTLVGWLGVPQLIAIGLCVIYLIFYLLVGTRWSNAACPLCGAPMFRKGLFYFGFFRCVNCGYDLKDPNTRRLLQ
jgi:hypothetical protein